MQTSILRSNFTLIWCHQHPIEFAPRPIISINASHVRKHYPFPPIPLSLYISHTCCSIPTLTGKQASNIPGEASIPSTAAAVNFLSQLHHCLVTSAFCLLFKGDHYYFITNQSSSRRSHSQVAKHWIHPWDEHIQYQLYHPELCHTACSLREGEVTAQHSLISRKEKSRGPTKDGESLLLCVLLVPTTWRFSLGCTNSWTLCLCKNSNTDIWRTVRYRQCSCD